MPKVTIIVPNYNHARYLRQRIDSVLGQTYRNFEVVLLDDCSTDESQAILAEYAGCSGVRIVRNGENSGSPFKQWNKGVALAHGEYVWIAESDDYADKWLLERLVPRLDGDPRAVLCYCRSWRVSANGQVEGYLDDWYWFLHPSRWTSDYSVEGREECEKYLVHCNTISNASAVLFRKEVYERVGGADENLFLTGDWKMWAAMALEGRVAYVGEPLNYFRSHETTIRFKSEPNGAEALEYLRVVPWILQRLGPSEATRRKVLNELFEHWYPKVLTNRIPFRRRWEIFTRARAVDRHALRKLIRPAFVALRMTLSRRYRSMRRVLSAND